jgi:hypothetical protein
VENQGWIGSFLFMLTLNNQDRTFSPAFTAGCPAKRTETGESSGGIKTMFGDAGSDATPIPKRSIPTGVD